VFYGLGWCLPTAQAKNAQNGAFLCVFEKQIFKFDKIAKMDKIAIIVFYFGKSYAHTYQAFDFVRSSKQFRGGYRQVAKRNGFRNS
jgi:hypothetical protein